MIKKHFLNKFTLGLVALALATTAFLLTTRQVKAQSETEGDWSPPVNISNSGGTKSPLMVVDSEGIFNIIWQDTLLEDVIYHTRGDGKSWTSPKAVSLPFGTTEPVLLTDAKGYFHAFWLSPEPNNGALYYSSVDSTDFGSEGWSEPQTVVTGTIAFDVLMDNQGTLHLVYIQGLADLPPGIFYTSSSNLKDWSSAKTLFQTPYFRSSSSTESSIHIVSNNVKSNQRALYVVWNNQARRRVSFVASTNNGSTWNTPMDVDTPDPSAPNTWPYNIRAEAIEDKVVLTWQYSQTDGSCTVYSDWSLDRGSTWRGKQRIIDEVYTCPQVRQMISDGQSLVFLLGTLEDQTIFLTWDGDRWSSIQEQTALNNFIDPETFSAVKLGCQQAVLASDEYLYLVTCDINGAGDIWFTSRTLDSLAEKTTSSTTAWSPPLVVSKQDGTISSLNLLTEPNHVLHAFWSQLEKNNNAEPVTAIYHTSYQPSIGWLHPLVILQSPYGAKNPKAIYSPKGTIFVFWNGGESGQIYYSWAPASQADSPLEWQSPVELPVLQEQGASFDVNVDETGVIRVLYAIPFNEHRGSYLTGSTDDGKSWSTPVQIFDGSAAQWDMVTQPLLTYLSGGRLQAVWAKYTFPGGKGPLSIYSSHSSDNGVSWSTPQEIINSPMTWASLFKTGSGEIHLLLLEPGISQTTLWHYISLDGGITWNKISIPLGSQNDPGLFSGSVDYGGQIHLFQVTDEGYAVVVQPWRWDGVRWLSETKLRYSKEKAATIDAVTASISDTGEMFVVYITSVDNPSTGNRQSSLYFNQRTLNLSAFPTPIPTQIPPEIQNTPTIPAATSEPIPTPTPTVDLANIPIATESAHNYSIIQIVGLGSVLAFIVIISGIAVKKVRR